MMAMPQHLQLLKDRHAKLKQRSRLQNDLHTRLVRLWQAIDADDERQIALTVEDVGETLEQLEKAKR